jgi:hypothetical protein
MVLNSTGSEGRPPSVYEVLRDLTSHPFELVVRRWNWKAALLSSLLRALIFFLH